MFDQDNKIQMPNMKQNSKKTLVSIESLKTTHFTWYMTYNMYLEKSLKRGQALLSNLIVGGHLIWSKHLSM